MFAAQKFDVGHVLATPAALAALEQAGQTPADVLSRHAAGDWGEGLCATDQQLNDAALAAGSRLLSAYRLASGRKLWVITEAVDEAGRRPATTLLLPDEY
ncbi:MAG: hypothetical protein AB7F89_10745 [Pirellulaceae bacterium]